MQNTAFVLTLIKTKYFPSPGQCQLVTVEPQSFVRCDMYVNKRKSIS